MWADKPLVPVDGKFVFKPNPHGVTYSVDASSPIGQDIAGRPVGIAVHSYGNEVEKSKDSPLVGRQSLQGLGGLSGTNEYITVFTGNMGTKFAMKEPTKLKNDAIRAVNKFATGGGDAFLSSLTQSSKDRLQQYYNRKSTGQPVDGTWLQTKLTKPQFEIVNAEENRNILKDLDKVYNTISVLKLAILDQLEPQVNGVEQFVGDVPKGEGFNIDTPSGFIKLVNRGVFSTANFAGRA
jgi:hypothetical protein